MYIKMILKIPIILADKDSVGSTSEAFEGSSA